MSRLAPLRRAFRRATAPRPIVLVLAWFACGAGAGPTSASDFALLPIATDTALLLLSGPIVRGDSQKLEGLLHDAPKSITIAGILLDSQGGALLEATRLARTVHTARWTAGVRSDAECASACVLIYAAAPVRFAGRGAWIGVHSVAQGGEDTVSAKAATVEMARTASEFGVPAEIIVKMVETRPGRIAWLTPADLKQWAVKVAPNGTDVAALFVPDALQRQTAFAASSVESVAAKHAAPGTFALTGRHSGTAEAAFPPPIAAAAAVLNLPASPTAFWPSATLIDDSRTAELASANAGPVGGTVTWTFTSAQKDGPEIVADVDIPQRRMKAKLTIRLNRDPSLPATHMIEVTISTPPDVSGRRVISVPSMEMKAATSGARGEALIGVAATVNPGVYWLALSGKPTDLSTNLRLLRRDLIDIRLVYSTGERAVLTLQKGPAGDQVFAAALAAWHL
jgi:hypothetical protein